MALSAVMAVLEQQPTTPVLWTEWQFFLAEQNLVVVTDVIRPVAVAVPLAVVYTMPVVIFGVQFTTLV